MASVLPIGVTAANTTGAQSTPALRLVRAAHEFEAQLMKELLTPMVRGGSLIGGEDDEQESAGTGPLGEFAAESLAGSLSAHGGLGIASRIIADLSRSGNPSQNSPVTGRSSVNTVINPRK